jgi:hypothetical protein
MRTGQFQSLQFFSYQGNVTSVSGFQSTASANPVQRERPFKGLGISASRGKLAHIHPNATLFPWELSPNGGQLAHFMHQQKRTGFDPSFNT